MKLEDILKQALAQDASDVHFTVGLPPLLRLDGRLQALDLPVLSPATAFELAEQIFASFPAGDLKEQFKKQGEVDFSYSLPGAGRFRGNIYRQRSSISLVFRVIALEVPDFKKLGLPEVLARLAFLPKGLVLVTGPTGSGKSTTLAAMVNLLNQNKDCCIITLEDPVEFLHRHDRAIVDQREIGKDTQSFEAGLRAALRQDPDVILVGEMRDYTTVSIALKAAETGHLVLSTLHTSGADKTIERIVDVFPADQQAQIRSQLAMSLEGIVSQVLLPKSSGKGRVALMEILVANPAVRNLIREGKTHQLKSVMQTGSAVGMQTFEQGLEKLLHRGLVDRKKIKDYLPEEMLGETTGLALPVLNGKKKQMVE
ncbi:type IV pilus twitching motility protein PilT [Peptococcaceae bacterium]|nr:type IV pilus twitching motility protein PilT [Peptococcaceae bacterium]